MSGFGGLESILKFVQGYPADKKHPPRKTPTVAYAEDHLVVPGEGLFLMSEVLMGEVPQSRSGVCDAAFVS